MRRVLFGLTALLVIGCGDDESSPGADQLLPSDAAGSPDHGQAADAGCPDLPDPAGSWIQPYQQEMVGRLAGATEVTPGIKLADRASSQNRALVRAYLSETLTALGLVPESDVYSSGENIHATLAASKPSESYLVIGAHFDSVEGSPGANDNATGVAAVIATARHLSAVSCRDKNVIFALFDEEELGARGSEHFAQVLRAASRSVVSVHTIDQMGWDEDGDRAIEVERPDAGLFALYQNALTLSGLDLSLTQTETGGTDHVSFRLYDFPAVGVTEEYTTGDTTPHYHLATDTFDTIDFDYLASTTHLWSVLFAALVRGKLP